MNEEILDVEFADEEGTPSDLADKERAKHEKLVQAELKDKPALTEYRTTVGAFNHYMLNNLVTDFTDLPEHHKLTALQVLPKGMIKSRVVGKANGRNIEAEYIPHEVAERALNFIFNFNVSQEIIDTSFETYETKKTDWETKKEKTQLIIEASATVKFTFTKKDGTQIVRTVISTHKGYENPAMARKTVLSGAVSKSWSVVAKTFGIGSNINQREAEAYQKVQDNFSKATPPTPPQATKAFATPNY